MIKVLAFDLDGTLTNDHKEITPLTFESLMKVQRQGLRIVLASGRPPYGMMPLCKQLHLDEYGGYMLAYNGGHVENCTTGEVLEEKKLDESLLPLLHRFQEESGMTLMTYFGDTIYTEHPDDQYVQVSSRNNKMKVEKVENFITDIPRPINKCLMVGNPQIVPHWELRMQEAFAGSMHILRSTPYFIELLPLGIDKGQALVNLMQKIGLTTDNLMAFGDSYNDIEMLRVAHIGVAMYNAEDAVKKVADLIAGSNNEDGIVKILKYL